MKKTKQLCLLAALSLTSLSVFSQTMAEADAAFARQDLKTAFETYTKLANEGDAVAQYQVGHFYESGRHVAQSFDNAEPWYRKSAMQGYAKSQANLAWLYVNGKGGLAKDIVQAVLWYEKAAAQGDREAQERIDNLYNFYPDLKASVRNHKAAILDKQRQEVAARQQAAFDAESEKNIQESRICLNKLSDDARTKSLAGKFSPFGGDSVPMEMLANTGKPNVKEKAALSYVVAEWEKCINIQAEPRKKYLPPEANTIISTYRLDLRSGFADLYSGKLSYGDMARVRAKLDIELKQKIDSLSAKIQAQEFAEAKQRQDAEAQQRYAEAQNQQQREAEKQRQAEARRALNMQEAQARAQLEQTRQLQRNVDFLQGLQMQQMFRPPPQPQEQIQPQQIFVQQAPAAPPPPRQCTSTRFGSTVTVNCF
ncbi:tetratricopeptide repeat protein [Undibacterium pigrum]|uniref:Sel1 repeat-containing protein n=1 Tax=Undibacterium pigrum TaxID=401470 RepID=A0A318IJL4_9BURK|nr:tetratricopeptide repeat protein [Undibacterium pigrum]PXX33702.1 Sel1 repeat-containing protein [Undibacterium pigrum]